MARRSLADVLPRIVRPRWRSVHELVRVGDGYVCMAAECPFASRDLTAVTAHAVAHQYVVEVQEREET